MQVPDILGDGPALRKQRGAFFTPATIAEFLAEWATAGRADARILDPTCGEAVFLLAAARRLAANGMTSEGTRELLYGVDLHATSQEESRRLLANEGFDASLVAGDFFHQTPPAQLGGLLPWMDAVVGNPPFVRYHEHRGDVRSAQRRRHWRRASAFPAWRPHGQRSSSMPARSSSRTGGLPWYFRPS